VKLSHTTVAILMNKEGELSTFLVCTYCPPDPDRNTEAISELRSMIMAINESFKLP